MTSLPVFVLLTPLVFAAVLFCGHSWGRERVLAINALGASAVFGLALFQWIQVWTGRTIVSTLASWPLPYGIALVADLFSASMVLVSTLVGFCVALSLRHNQEFDPGRFGYAIAFQTLLTGVCGVFLSGDLFNMYVWFEVMVVSSFVLFVYEAGKAQLAGAMKYAVPNYLASLLFLSAAGLLYGTLGTLNLADLANRIHEALSGTPNHQVAIRSAFVFLIFAFCLKAGAFPLSFWLPASYPVVSVPTLALFAGLLTKVGLYALVRTSTLLFPDVWPFSRTLLLIVAGLSMVTGILGAISQFEIRRILSYHIISQIGYMILGFALGTKAALMAAVFYVIHHILVKTNLFLIGGLICQVGGTFDLKKTGGLARHYPFLAAIFFIPAFSLAGFPLLSGFFAKFSLLKAGFDEGAYVLMGIALGVSFLTLISMLKIWIEAFWKPVPLKSNAPPFRALSWGQLLPLLIMAGSTLALGLWPQLLFGPAERIADEIRGRNVYVEAVLGEAR